LGGYSAIDIYSSNSCDKVDQVTHDIDIKLEDLKLAGFNAKECRSCGFTAKDLKDVGYLPLEVKQAGYNPGEMFRAGFNKSELKPIGCWKHDGSWQNYNCYWSCCHSLEKSSEYCLTI
jgi:hypothetical protein